MNTTKEDTVETKALERARRGAAWLDKKLGKSWRRKIRRRKLKMSKGVCPSPGDCGCILAQLYGRYEEGANALGMSDPYGNRAVALGFYSHGGYADLDEAWRQVLREGVPA